MIELIDSELKQSYQKITQDKQQSSPYVKKNIYKSNLSKSSYESNLSKSSYESNLSKLSYESNSSDDSNLINDKLDNIMNKLNKLEQLNLTKIKITQKDILNELSTIKKLLQSLHYTQTFILDELSFVKNALHLDNTY